MCPTLFVVDSSSSLNTESSFGLLTAAPDSCFLFPLLWRSFFTNGETSKAPCLSGENGLFTTARDVVLMAHRKVRCGGFLKEGIALSPNLAQLRGASALMLPRRPPINVTWRRQSIQCLRRETTGAGSLMQSVCVCVQSEAHQFLCEDDRIKHELSSTALHLLLGDGGQELEALSINGRLARRFNLLEYFVYRFNPSKELVRQRDFFPVF